MSDYPKETEKQIEYLESLLEKMDFPVDDEITNPDKRLAFTVGQVLRMLHERIESLEPKP